MILGSSSTRIIGKTRRMWLLFCSLVQTSHAISHFESKNIYARERYFFRATIDPYKPGGSWISETKREKCNRKRVPDVIFPEQLLLFGRTSHFSHIIIIIVLFRNGKRTSATAVSRSNTRGIFIDLHSLSKYYICGYAISKDLTTKTFTKRDLLARLYSSENTYIYTCEI